MLLKMTSKHPLADAIKSVIFREHRNYSIIITGKPQKRKSTIAVTLAFEINPDFKWDIDFAIIKGSEFLRILRDPAKKRGEVKVCDEFGQGMSHHKWYTFLNNAMVGVMETHGHEGRVVIVTVPYEDYVDKDALKLFDMRITVLGKNDNKRYAICKVEELEYNDKTKTLYSKFPRGKYPDGTVKRIEQFRISYPIKEILTKYFEISNPAKLTLKDDLYGQSIQIERDRIKHTFNPETYVAQIIATPDKFIKTIWGRKYVSRESIMNEFLGVGDTRARQIKNMAEERLRANAVI